jgi:hypothetical protein
MSFGGGQAYSAPNHCAMIFALALQTKMLVVNHWIFSLASNGPTRQSH